MLLVAIALMLSACSAATLSTAAAANPSAGAATGQSTAPVAVAPSGPVAAAGSIADLQQTLENIYAQVNPSVVAINVIENAAAGNQGFGGLPQGHPNVPATALGSGFVWDKDGHIVTNNHVVDGASKVSVTFYDGTIVPATVVGTDPDSDLAVIKVDVPADQLQPVTLGDSTQVKVGQLAVAIGNPFGNQNTMTVGFISALARSLPVDNSTSGLSGSYTIPDVIQTDAPINPGNSGGVLTDDSGKVVGVTSAIDSPVRASVGIGFAIPSAIVGKVVPELIKSGKYEHSWIGISGRTLIPDLATAMNLKSDQRGVLVGDVATGSPAEKAGLRGSTQNFTLDGQTVQVGGDVITAIDNQPVKTFDDLVAYLARSTTVGQQVTLTILRDGQTQTVNLTLAARPATNTQSAATLPQVPSLPTVPNNRGNGTGAVWLGIQGLTLTPDLAQAMNLKADQQGVLVEQVVADSPAQRAGLQAGSTTTTLNGQDIQIGGDVITAFNGQPITSMQQLQRAVQRAGADTPVTLTVLRNGKSMDISVTLAARPVVQ
jgi:S1-C subfamily serine protease